MGEGVGDYGFPTGSSSSTASTSVSGSRSQGTSDSGPSTSRRTSATPRPLQSVAVEAVASRHRPYLLFVRPGPWGVRTRGPVPPPT